MEVSAIPMDLALESVEGGVGGWGASKGQKESSGNDLIALANEDATENLMQNHDSFISVLQSRLTKLQVVRHFWIRNDIKGAINAVGRLPDHSVDRIDVVTLNIFTSLLPLLTCLIDSKVDRYTGT
ncbi:hypothetical protein MRB53_021820 [Persea americana]|uniref:Uncharacterized protein n=1 Tax=Persea americana TaxID=3435 RepID=A0ACC2L652_PERAE|nr:hypothetical protein MRB53_021820 [Persea americana]